MSIQLIKSPAAPPPFRADTHEIRLSKVKNWVADAAANPAVRTLVAAASLLGECTPSRPTEPSIPSVSARTHRSVS